MNGAAIRYAVRRRIRTAAYLRKWVVLGALIGVISGLGAALFFVALDLAGRFFLGAIAGFTPASPAGEGAKPITDAAPAVGDPAGGRPGRADLRDHRVPPRARGRGPRHRRRDRARTTMALAGSAARIPLIKLVASAITIGSGGSGGREGPTAQIGAGFGSFLARVLDLDARDARIAVACGMGAGIGAIFRAPLGGAVLAAEIPYREDVESEALVPAFVASIVAFSIFGAIIGFAPIFGRVASAGFTDARQLVYYALIGLAAGLVGRLYIGSFYGLTAWFSRWRLPREVRPAIAGVAVGCLGLALPGVLGTGYGWVQAGLDRTTLLGSAPVDRPRAAVRQDPRDVPVDRIRRIGRHLRARAWSSAACSGPASGGSSSRSRRRMPVDPSPFVIVAMMALFGSIAHAPLAVMLMVAEMTDSLSMLAPAMLAIGIATLVVGDRSIYSSQIRSRADSPAHRFRFGLPLMAAIPAGDAARMPRAVLHPDDLVSVGRERLVAAGVSGAPVVEADGRVRGSLDLAILAAADPDAAVGTLPADGPVISADDALDDVLGILADAHRSWAPVVADDRLAGILSSRDVVAAYRTALAANVRQVRAVGTTGALIEAEIGPASALAGAAVATTSWPRDSVLVSIARGDRVIVPRGDVRLETGDRLTVFSAPAARQALEALLGSEIAANEAEA